MLRYGSVQQHPRDYQQRRYLDALQGAAAQAADTLKASCQTRPEDVLTPAARLAAVGQRLNAMLQAVKTVRMPIDDFYGSLTDSRKRPSTRSVRSRLAGADTSAVCPDDPSKKLPDRPNAQMNMEFHTL